MTNQMSVAELKIEIFRRIADLPDEQFMETYKLLMESVFQTARKEKRTIGSIKGLVLYMADDFDAPLDDFKEYMP